MKKIFIAAILFILCSNLCVYASSDLIKSKLFSVVIPKDLKGTYKVKKSKDTISIYHIESEKAGFGGFAFGIRAYKNPSDHAILPGSIKLGELTDKKGVLYDIVLKHPTDVQYDYTKSPKAPPSYKRLYDLGNNAEISGIKGATYYRNQGMKGEDLYKDVLKKHVRAINEKWDSVKLEKENMSYMYNVIASSGGNVSDKIGYFYYDVNADGIEELFIGEIAEGAWKGIIYDIYTMVNRKPEHVISGGSRNRYYVCDDCFICNEYSGGAAQSGTRVYILVENSTELFPQVAFKYDAYKNAKNPWFLSYGSDADDDNWENVSQEVYDERKKIFDRYERFNYIPLSKIKY